MNGKFAKGHKIRIVLDNRSTHTSQKRRGYLAEHPGRFEFVFTPKHASRLNMIEEFFSKFARGCLKGIRVGSREELVRRSCQYMGKVNAQPAVCRWKYKRDEMVVQLLHTYLKTLIRDWGQ